MTFYGEISIFEKGQTVCLYGSKTKFDEEELADVNTNYLIYQLQFPVFFFGIYTPVSNRY